VGRFWLASVAVNKEDFFERVTCQVLPLCRLGEGAQALDAPLD
jgi:hypothetical protein